MCCGKNVVVKENFYCLRLSTPHGTKDAMIDIYTYIVLVEHPEHQRSELARIALWEELLVDLDEALIT